MACGTSETNASTMGVCGTGRGLWCRSYPAQTQITSFNKSSSVNTSFVTVTNAVIFNACMYV